MTNIAVALSIVCAASLAMAEDANTNRVMTKLGISSFSGSPDLFGVSMAVAYPNILEAEAGASYMPRPGWSAYGRLGYPWRVYRNPETRYSLFLIPKVGLRYTKFAGGPSDSCQLYFCDSVSHDTCSYRDSDALGINAVLSFEPTFYITERFGLLLQLAGGVTATVRGHDNSVTLYCNALDERTVEEPVPVRADLKVAFGFVF